LHDPDAVVLVHVHPGHLPQDPVLRERLWPERVDLEPGPHGLLRHDEALGVILLGGRLDRSVLTDGQEGGDERYEQK
jgi:hypothetical protein